MPELKQSKFTPQPVRQDLQLPDAFPSLPPAIKERFGAAADDFDASAKKWWQRTKRILSDSHYELARPQNEIKQDARNIRKEFVAADAMLAAGFDEAITVVVNDLSAVVTRTETLEASVNNPGEPGGLLARVITNAAASVARDGNLSAKWTAMVEVQTGTGRKVITGINLTSTTDGGTDVSEVNIMTDHLRLITSTIMGAGGDPIQLLDITADGFVFGADLASDNYDPLVSGWLLTRDGTIEVNDAIVRGTIYSSLGMVGGFDIDSNRLHAGSGGSAIELNSLTSSLLFGQLTGRAAIYSLAGLAAANGALQTTYDLANDTGGFGRLRLYNAGTVKITLDGSTGNGDFAGTLHSFGLDVDGTGDFNHHSLIGVDSLSCYAINCTTIDTNGYDIDASAGNLTVRRVKGETGGHLFFEAGGSDRWSVSDTSGDLIARSGERIKPLSGSQTVPLVAGSTAISFSESSGHLYVHFNGGAGVLVV